MDGTAAAQLTNDPGEDGEPAWSPDGSKIAFLRKVACNYAVFVMNADKGERDHAHATQDAGTYGGGNRNTPETRHSDGHARWSGSARPARVGGPLDRRHRPTSAPGVVVGVLNGVGVVFLGGIESSLPRGRLGPVEGRANPEAVVFPFRFGHAERMGLRLLVVVTADEALVIDQEMAAVRVRFAVSGPGYNRLVRTQLRTIGFRCL